MTFFYDLNKKMADLAAKQTLTEGTVAEAGYSAKAARAGHDLGQPGKNFGKIAKGAAERYGSKAAGERVPGAVLNKLRHPKEAYVPSPGNIHDPYGDEASPEEHKAYQDEVNLYKTPGAHPALASIGMHRAQSVHDRLNKVLAKKPGVAEADMEEGNEFSGELAKAKAQHRDTFNVDGKSYPVKEEGGLPMTAKQKSFAALAPPKDKITFADKIAGAKKEVDEMLGDVAANAIKGALGGKQGATEEIKTRKIAGNRYGGARQIDKPEHDEAPKGKSKAGRPEGDQLKADFGAFGIGKPVKLAKHKGAVTKHELGDKTPARGQAADAAFKASEKAAKGAKKVKESPGLDIADRGEYDQEGEMAKDDIKTIVRHAQALEKVLGDNDNLPEWVQAKLAKIEGMMTAVDDYMQNQQDDDMDGEQEPIDEKAKSKKQQRFMGMVRATQKGEKAPSKEVGKVAKTMKKSDAEDFASTKHKGLPEKVGKKKKEEVEETTTSGSVATGGSSSGKGSVYGKGIYDSINREVEAMIAEGMTINMSMNSDSQGGPTKSLTVTATDEDAEQLAQMLSNAGMSAQTPAGAEEMHGHDHDHKDTCNECGMTYESCECNEGIGGAIGGGMLGGAALGPVGAIGGALLGGAITDESACPSCGMQGCGCGDIEEALDENNPDWPTEKTGQEDNINYYDTDGLNGRKSTGQTTIPVIASQDDRQQAYEDEDLARMMEMAGLTSEGFGDVAKKVGSAIKTAGGKVLDTLGHEDDVLKDLQQKAGIPAHAQHGKPNMAQSNEKEVDESAESIAGLGPDAQSLIMKLRRDVEEKRLHPTRQAVLAAASELAGDMDFAPELLVRQVLGRGVAEDLEESLMRQLANFKK